MQVTGKHSFRFHRRRVLYGMGRHPAGADGLSDDSLPAAARSAFELSPSAWLQCIPRPRKARRCSPVFYSTAEAVGASDASLFSAEGAVTCSSLRLLFSSFFAFFSMSRLRFSNW